MHRTGGLTFGNNGGAGDCMIGANVGLPGVACG
jgi:hypothetical protein